MEKLYDMPDSEITGDEGVNNNFAKLDAHFLANYDSMTILHKIDEFKLTADKPPQTDMIILLSHSQKLPWNFAIHIERACNNGHLVSMQN